MLINITLVEIICTAQCERNWILRHPAAAAVTILFHPHPCCPSTGTFHMSRNEIGVFYASNIKLIYFNSIFLII
jgi:hypothetical protein